MIIKKRNNGHKNNFEYISVIFIIIFTLALAIYVLSTPNYPTGETLSFVIPTLSILQGDWCIATPKAIQTAINQMPDFADYIISQGDTRYNTSLPDGGFIPLYFPLYSIVCIPVRIILKIFHINQSYTFRLTNVLLFSLALFFIFKKIRIQSKNKLYLLLLLAVNPVLFYVVYWVSFETCIWFFVIISLVYWYNGNYKLASIFISLASTMNMTVLFLGFIMVIHYLINLYLNDGQKNLFKLIFKHIKNLLLYAACFTPIFLPLISNIYVKLITGVKPFALTSNATGKFYFERFFSYLFDLNFGYLPYVPVLLICFFGIFIYSIIKIKKEYNTLLYTFGFIAVVLGYTAMSHINCGMQGIARYSAWAMPMMIFPIIMFSDKYYLKLKKYIKIIFPVSLIISLFVIIGTYKNPYKGWDQRFGFAAEYILDKAPSLYNPYHATFNSRTNNIHGGYIIKEPVIYSNKDGYVRKMLLSGNSKDIEYVYNIFTFETEKDKEYIDKKITKVKGKNKLRYINVPNPYKVYSSDYLPVRIGQSVNINLEDYRLYKTNYFGDSIFTINNEGAFVLYGPYLQSIIGRYSFTVLYEVIENNNDTDIIGFIDVFSWSKGIQFGISEMKASSNVCSIEDIYFSDFKSIFENRIFLNNGVSVKILNIEITKIE